MEGCETARVLQQKVSSLSKSSFPMSHRSIIPAGSRLCSPLELLATRKRKRSGTIEAARGTATPLLVATRKDVLPCMMRAAAAALGV